jgi:hypothetical protein
MEDVRCDEFDLLMVEVLKVREAGLPVPDELLYEAVEVMANCARKRTRDFTLPALGRLKFLKGASGLHTLEDDLGKGGSEPLTNRGFFQPLEVMKVLPSVQGGPIQEDAVAESIIPGRIVLMGFCPDGLQNDFRVYVVSYVCKDGVEKAVSVSLEVGWEKAIGLADIYPVAPMFLLKLMRDGFGEISANHLRLAEKANRIAAPMGHQIATLGRLLEQTPKSR